MHFNNWAEYWASGMGWYLTASLMRSSQCRMIHRTVIVTAHDQDEGERQIGRGETVVLAGIRTEAFEDVRVMAHDPAQHARPPR